MRVLGRIGLVLLACVLLAGCGVKGHGAAPDPREALLERVTLWHEYKITQDAWDAYELIWSGYKEIVPQKDYLKRRTGLLEIQEYEIRDIAFVGEDQAEVLAVSNFVAFGGYELKGRKEKQTWMLEDGQWYIKLKPVISTPFGDIPIKKDDAME